MTDSPMFRNPMDPREQPILDRLLYIRDQLLLVKQDKSKYVKSVDVSGYYEDICTQVKQLNSIRTNKRLEQNRLDTVLDDCLQLISLFFMTVGRNDEAPAAYALVSTIKRLLDHLKEAAFFAEKDISGISHRLERIEKSVERGRPLHHDVILTLLENRIQTCRETLKELRLLLAPIPAELMPTHEKLVSILRSLSGCNARTNFPAKEVEDFKRQLKEIEKNFDGKASEESSEELSIDERLRRYAVKLQAITYSEASKLSGKEIVRDLLERTILWADIISVRQGRLDARFKEHFDQLNGVRTQLEKLSLTQAWSLRETDLYQYQRKLDRADEARVGDNFLDEKGQPAELYEQRTLLYLLRKSYATIYFMLTSSEPVSEALQPIYNQLSTLRKCLVEVKRSGGCSSPRELYPYSMKLHSLDNMRQDGRFVVNGDIPEGQASVTALLNECFEMAYELRNDAAEQGDEADKDGKDDDKGKGKEKDNHDEDDGRPVTMKEGRVAASQNEDGSDTGLTRTTTRGRTEADDSGLTRTTTRGKQADSSDGGLTRTVSVR